MTTDLKTIPYYFVNSGTAKRMAAANDVVQNDLIAEAFYSWEKLDSAYNQLAAQTVRSFGQMMEDVYELERPSEYFVSVTWEGKGVPVITKWIEHQGSFYKGSNVTLQAVSIDVVRNQMATITIGEDKYIARELDSFIPQLYVSQLVPEGLANLAKTRKRLQDSFNEGRNQPLYENKFNIPIFMVAITNAIGEWNEHHPNAKLRTRIINNGFIIEPVTLDFKEARLLKIKVSSFETVTFNHPELKTPISYRNLNATSPTEVATVSLSSGGAFTVFAQTHIVTDDGAYEEQHYAFIRLFDLLNRTLTNPVQVPIYALSTEASMLKALNEYTSVMFADEVVLG